MESTSALDKIKVDGNLEYTNVPILFYCYADWLPNKNEITFEDVKKYNVEYLPIDITIDTKFAEFYNVKVIPTYILATPKGKTSLWVGDLSEGKDKFMAWVDAKLNNNK